MRKELCWGKTVLARLFFLKNNSGNSVTVALSLQLPFMPFLSKNFIVDHNFGHFWMDFLQPCIQVPFGGRLNLTLTHEWPCTKVKIWI